MMEMEEGQVKVGSYDQGHKGAVMVRCDRRMVRLLVLKGRVRVARRPESEERRP